MTANYLNLFGKNELTQSSEFQAYLIGDENGTMFTTHSIAGEYIDDFSSTY